MVEDFASFTRLARRANRPAVLRLVNARAKIPEAALAALPIRHAQEYVYCEINLHITWHTKLSDPVLVETIENRVHHYLEHKARETVRFHAVGGTENHVHLVVTIPPSLLISDWVGKLKGGSSFYINHEIANRKLLDWQGGYGVVSFGTKDLDWVVRYVNQQKEHHAAGSINNRLERCDEED